MIKTGDHVVPQEGECTEYLVVHADPTGQVLTLVEWDNAGAHTFVDWADNYARLAD